MNYLEAKNKWELKKPFIFSENRYGDEEFLVEDVEVKKLHPVIFDPKIVEKYKDYFINKKYIRPIWVYVGRKMRKGHVVPDWDSKVKIVDGNHRSMAAKELLISTIKAN